MFDALKYVEEHHIEYTDKHPRYSSIGWINIECPFCSGKTNPGPHGGFNLEKGFYSCWGCGWHSLEDVITALEHIPYHEACNRVREYDTDTAPIVRTRAKHESGRTTPPPFPIGTTLLTQYQKLYLLKRGYNPDYLIQKYGLRGTGPSAVLSYVDETGSTKELNYCHRIMIPIFVNGVMVSYQGRDQTDLSETKYKACPIELEMIHHKYTLYNLDHCLGKSCIVVEGVTDVWRLGDNALATFGTGYKLEQEILLGERFQRIVVLFDSEPKAQEKAMKLVSSLKALGRDSFNIRLNAGDPGDLSNEEARKLMQEFIL